jgi:hypothetical protein
MIEDRSIGPFSELRWIPALERAGAAVFRHDSIFLQAMESPPKSGQFIHPKPAMPASREGDDGSHGAEFARRYV